jgi:hypothetical protein
MPESKPPFGRVVLILSHCGGKSFFPQTSNSNNNPEKADTITPAVKYRSRLRRTNLPGTQDGRNFRWKDSGICA